MAIRDMILVALFTAVICVLGLIPPITLPFSPVPITAQTLGVMLAGAILGARLGGLSMLLFVSLIAIGAPVAAGGRGGLSVLLGPSGGYLIGFIVGAFVIGLLVELFWHRLRFYHLLVFNMLGGIIVVYAFGIPYLAFVTEIPLDKAALPNLAYLPGDIAKAIVATLIAMQVHRIKPLIRPRVAKATTSQQV